jgi:hypothetical protein
MKYLMLILICLLALGACQVTYAEEASTAIPQQKLVNLDLKDTPLKNAIEMLFKESGYNYALSSDLNKPPFSSLQLNLKLQNVSFEAALSSLTKAANLMWSTDKNDNKVFTISPTASQPSMPPPPPQPTYGPNSAPSGPNPNQQPEPDKNLITMRIPPMPIIHALQKVDPGWGFSPENLENKAMPGASFYNFPREGAAYVLMIAAGLVPPSDSGKTITQSGKANLQDYFQWKPAASEAAPVDSSGQSGFGGSYGGGS